MTGKIDTRAIGLDVGVAFTRWLTGAENLHYGLWDGLEPAAANLRAAQEAYTSRLFSLLPEGTGLRILDIGGGAGETAGRLLSMGHQVEIVVPSTFLAERCRENAPGARVHRTTFEAFDGEGPFDVCLFSESFQYIPLEVGLRKAFGLLAPGGRVILADCFRTDAVLSEGGAHRPVGGGHLLSAFDALLDRTGAVVLDRRDVTRSVAPSVEIEQELFLVLGGAIDRIDAELREKRPKTRAVLATALRLLLGRRRLSRLGRRLRERTRTAEAFARYNRYLVLALEPGRAA
ncbi:MAG: methyltransferase domain-containing protein [Alphaproteobacteria bacterium]|nr:MAG: methyltransferase domain-containing protein [Alphaproteobacteria bacterium]